MILPFIKTSSGVLFCTSLLFSACKKNSTEPPADPIPLIKTVTITSNGGTPSVTTYTHENGKVKSRVYGNGTSNMIRYSGDSVITSSFNAASQPTGGSYSVMNNKGYAQALTQTDLNGNIIYNESRQYNNDNFVIKSTITTYAYPAFYDNYYTGNRLDSVIYSANGKIMFRNIVEETTGIANTISNVNYGASYFGKSGLLLKKNINYFYNSAGVLTESIQYSYTYETDANSRIIKQTSISNSSVSGTSTTIYEYSYY